MSGYFVDLVKFCFTLLEHSGIGSSTFSLCCLYPVNSAYCRGCTEQPNTYTFINGNWSKMIVCCCLHQVTLLPAKFFRVSTVVKYLIFIFPHMFVYMFYVCVCVCVISMKVWIILLLLFQLLQQLSQALEFLNIRIISWCNFYKIYYFWWFLKLNCTSKGFLDKAWK